MRISSLTFPESEGVRSLALIAVPEFAFCFIGKLIRLLTVQKELMQKDDEDAQSA
jgi:hypothetical protein